MARKPFKFTGQGGRRHRTTGNVATAAHVERLRQAMRGQGGGRSPKRASAGAREVAAALLRSGIRRQAVPTPSRVAAFAFASAHGIDRSPIVARWTFRVLGVAIGIRELQRAWREARPGDFLPTPSQRRAAARAFREHHARLRGQRIEVPPQENPAGATYAGNGT